MDNIDTLTLRRVPQDCFSYSPVGDEKPIVFIDLETTGLDPEADEILEIGMVRGLYSPSAATITALEGSCSMYRDPGRQIPEFITRLTGITNEKVAGQKICSRTMAQFLQGDPLMVAHNAGFDAKFFRAAWPRLEFLWACSSKDPDWRDLGYEGNKLEYLVFKHGYFYEGHRAEVDCWALSLLMRVNPEAFRRVIEAPHVDRYLIRAFGAPFSEKDYLKGQGFRWNGDRKVWEINATDPDLSRWSSALDVRSFSVVKLDPRKRFL